MQLIMKVGLSPGDFVLDGDPALPFPQMGRAPIFGPCLLSPNGWMDQDVSWYGGRPRLRRHCVRWDPAPSPEREARPNFRPLSIVAKQQWASEQMVRPKFWRRSGLRIRIGIRIYPDPDPCGDTGMTCLGGGMQSQCF